MSLNVVPIIALELTLLQLRDVRDRALFLREMADRRETILKSIDEQGKLDPALRAR